MTTTITNTVVVTDSCLEWWLAGGISAANCLAAYQPKGAASYAASKVNLANPGTYDAVDGVAFPTWAAATGWTFNGVAQYLTSNCPTDMKPMSYIARVKNTDNTNFNTIIGPSVAGGLSLDLTSGTNIPRLLKAEIALIGAATAGFNNNGDTVIGASYSAAHDWVHYLDGASNGSGNNDQTPVASTLMIGTQTAAITQPHYGTIM